MSILAREHLTARLVGEAGVKVAYEFDPASSFKWTATLHHPSFKLGRTWEFASTAWGLNVQIRRTARRVIKSQAMQFRADQMTKAVAS